MKRDGVIQRKKAKKKINIVENSLNKITDDLKKINSKLFEQFKKVKEVLGISNSEI